MDPRQIVWQDINRPITEARVQRLETPTPPLALDDTASDMSVM
jgi:hypothetical protein